MEIIKSNSEVLHFVSRRSKRLSLLHLVCSLPFIGMGIAGLSSANITTLECDRASSNKIECRRSVMDILGRKTTEKLPGNLQAARIRQEGSKATAYLELLTTTKTLLFTPRFFSVFDNTTVINNANKLDNFIKNLQADKINIEQDDRLSGVLFGGLGGAFGIAIIYFYLRIPLMVVCRFDRNLDRAIIDTKYLSCCNTQEISPLSKIKKVRLKEDHAQQNRAAGVAKRYFEVVLILEGDNFFLFQQKARTWNYTRQRLKRSSSFWEFPSHSLILSLQGENVGILTKEF